MKMATEQMQVAKRYIIEWREVSRSRRPGEPQWCDPPPDKIMVVNGREVASLRMNWGGWWEVYSFVHRMNWWPADHGWQSDMELRYAMDLVVDEFAGDARLERGWKW
jgi:hypothetical protein